MGEVDKKRPLTSTATARNRINLLLHCVDGCVPYLNPYQLEEHFSPSETDLWLGLAVRDTCVAPIFNSSSASEKTKGGKKKGKAKKEQTASSTNKVRGYTFAATPPDPWLLPYTRLTVPSFDLRNVEEHTTKGNSNGNASKNTNNSVYVWTPHGRQKLTADLYATASLEGLQSDHTVSLFDDVDETEFSVRRKQKAESRNEEWFHYLSSRQDALVSEKPPPTNDAKNDTVGRDSGGSCPFLWKPILLPHEAEKLNPEDESTDGTASYPKEPVDKGNTEERVPSGVAFVGRWRHGLQLKEMVHKHISTNHSDTIQWKAILTTYSLSEILEIARSGIVNVIGTNLPQKWAKEKLALGLDLSTIESSLGIPVAGRDPKRQKISNTETAASSKAKAAGAEDICLSVDGCMDMSQKVYARDPYPLVAGCDCFVCRENRFSRAYIHHLVVAKEMVAEILLFGHNLHCILKLLRFFDSEESVRNEVIDFIHGQLPTSETTEGDA